MYDTTELASNVRTTRKRLGLTQAQLALAAGVGVRFIVDLENAKPRLQLNSLLKVLDALGADVEIRFPMPLEIDHD